jgi:uncharacterized membrane protein YkvA (DUF1232 family)
MKTALMVRAAKGDRWAGALLMAGLLYGASPIDVIPDVLPLIGVVDDIVIVPTLLFLAFKMYRRNHSKSRVRAQILPPGIPNRR